MKTNLVDQPKLHNEIDQLDLKKYEDALVKLLCGADTPLTIALQGEWGSGKTSLMNSLSYRLTDPKSNEACFHKIWVNTWEYSLISEPLESIVNILSSIIMQIAEFSNHRDKGSKILKTICGGFTKGAVFGAKMVANAVVKTGTGIDDVMGMSQNNEQSKEGPVSKIRQAKDEIKEMIELCLASNSKIKGFIFFIDDLDRIDPPMAVHILELLKNIFDLEKCVFMLAIDYDVVVKGLKPKFGKSTPANEREFRSFFDKIIQVPFSMPVASYQVDGFLIESLKRVGFLRVEDVSDSNLSEALAFFCRSSVGTNPRSLKRLVNILSLIQILNEQNAPADRIQKQVDFALVCLQISFSRVYGFLVSQPDFTKWDASFRKQHGLGELDQEIKTKLSEDEKFNDEWEQTLYLICKDHPYLQRMVYQISAILNRMAALDTPEISIGERVHAAIGISSVTHVSQEEPIGPVDSFHQSSFLKQLHEKLLEKVLPLAQEQGLVGFAQTSGRIQTRLCYEAKFNGSNSELTNADLSIYPIDDKFCCHVYVELKMLWDENNAGDLETELRKIGKTKKQFDALIGKVDNLGSNRTGWLRPAVLRPDGFGPWTSEKCYYFDFRAWFKFYAKSPDEFLRDDFIITLAETLVEALCLQVEIANFLKPNEADIKDIYEGTP